MFNVEYEISKKNRDLTFNKVLIALSAVFVFFVLPCITINTVQRINQEDQLRKEVTQQVAGISTTSEEVNNKGTYIPFLNSFIDISPQSGLFIIVAIVLFTIAFALILYLILQDKRKNRKFKY